MKKEAYCRLCRRNLKKLFLKGERCETPKCAFIRKGYVPGIHGLKRHLRLSGYAIQLRAKQTLKNSYFLTETQMKNLFSRKQNFEKILTHLELRLDNICYRLGFFPSRRASRQAIIHRKILVNKKRQTFPGLELKINDEISVLGEIEAQNREIPKWLKLNQKEKKGKILENPDVENIKNDFSGDLIREFYLR